MQDSKKTSVSKSLNFYLINHEQRCMPQKHAVQCTYVYCTIYNC